MEDIIYDLEYLIHLVGETLERRQTIYHSYTSYQDEIFRLIQEINSDVDKMESNLNILSALIKDLQEQPPRYVKPEAIHPTA